MSASNYDLLQLAGRYVPADNSGPFETMQEANAAGHDSLNPTTGAYQIGVLVDGAFVTLIEEQASQFFALVATAKALLAAQQSAAPASDTSASVPLVTPQ